MSFHNRAGGTIERWLPGTPFQGGSRSEEEDPRTMDSWYLLHILLNVGRVAAMGYEDAAKVFLTTVDYASKAPIGSGSFGPSFTTSGLSKF